MPRRRRITISLTAQQFQALVLAVDSREQDLIDQTDAASARNLKVLQAAWAKLADAWYR